MKRKPQYEAVVEALKAEGGLATLARLIQIVPALPGYEWKTKTPFASIRRIVQEHEDLFFRIRPGLWGLKVWEADILGRLGIPGDAPPERHAAFDHSYYQGLLLEIGRWLAFETFVPNQDKNKPYVGGTLADVSSMDRYPTFTYEHVVQRVCTVDVSWFNERGYPSRIFEVEHSTDMWNSLLKFVELRDFRVKFYVVANEVRRSEFESKLRSSAFQGIRDDVRFLAYEAVSRYHSQETSRSAFRNVCQL